MGTRYEQGRDAEYRACEELEAEGFTTARLAGSHGTADVIGWNERIVRWIQIKTFRSPKPPSYTKDRQQLEALRIPPGHTAELWVRKIGQRGWLDKIVIQGPQEQPA